MTNSSLVVPEGSLHPRRVKAGVVAGVQDYGNKLGLPNVSGAILYDESFTATPIPRPLTSADWDSLPTASPLGDKQVAEMRRLFDSVPGTLPGLARSEERG